MPKLEWIRRRTSGHYLRFTIHSSFILYPSTFTLCVSVPRWRSIRSHFHHAGDAHGGDGANLVQHLRRDLIVHVHEADRFLGRLVTPESEVGDVDPAVAEQRAYAPDHAGNVPIADVEDEALQPRLDV